MSDEEGELYILNSSGEEVTEIGTLK